MSLSLSHPNISDYFNSKPGAHVPVSELLYIHSHPLVSPNFLVEIEELINETSEFMQKRNMRGGPVVRLTKLAESLGKQLPLETEESAAEALKVLRQIYQLCLKITGKR